MVQVLAWFVGVRVRLSWRLKTAINQQKIAIFGALLSDAPGSENLTLNYFCFLLAMTGSFWFTIYGCANRVVGEGIGSVGDFLSFSLFNHPPRLT